MSRSFLWLEAFVDLLKQAVIVFQLEAERRGSVSSACRLNGLDHRYGLASDAFLC